MNKALFLISVQHELSMAIGEQLELAGNLKGFLRVCLKRLNLTSAHVFIHQTPQGLTSKRGSKVPDNSQLKHYISLPRRYDGIDWSDNKYLPSLLSNAECEVDYTIKQSINSHSWYRFNIAELGYLLLESKQPLEAEILRAMSPIMQKLAGSCYASVVHDSLVSEIEARKQAEQQINFQASHDALTNLYNRRFIKNLLAQAYTNAKVEQTFGAALFIDLNKFKPINDLMGHNVGDKILINVAERLLRLASPSVQIARFGGDEFVVLISELDAMKNIACEQVQQVIDDINQQMNEPFEIEGHIYNMSCSIGYVLFPDQVPYVEDILKFADIAMYEAKHSNVKTGLMYQPHMSDKLSRRLAFIDEIKKALQNNEFNLHYQPQFNHEGKIIGAEALLRWYNPKRGLVLPDEYIAIAEESDLIIPIGHWVLKQACADMKTLEMQGLPEHFKKISVNVSAKQLLQKDFKDSVLKSLSVSAINPNHLALELTESLLIESFKDTIDLIASLKELGVNCSIDDFGKGYSSLTYLKRLPASVIKIDRSFIANIHDDEENKAIAKMIIGLGKSLNMEVLAEGVETELELTCLQELGCFEYQGFYFSKPMPFHRLKQVLVPQDSEAEYTLQSSVCL